MGLAPGTHLGPYEITGALGAGGMGEVYRARDPRLGRDVAIKFLPADRLADPSRRARFLQEARAASALSHPNIVTIHEVEPADGCRFIVMERLIGKARRADVRHAAQDAAHPGSLPAGPCPWSAGRGDRTPPPRSRRRERRARRQEFERKLEGKMTTVRLRPLRRGRAAGASALLLVLLLAGPSAAQPDRGDEGGECMDAMGTQGPWCGGLGVSCLPTAQWGLKCIKCGGKGEVCCNPMNILNTQGSRFECVGSSDPDERFRMDCIRGVCMNTSSFAARYCGSPGYPPCSGPGGTPYCWGTSIVGSAGVCMETGRYYQRCNQGDAPREARFKCDSPGTACVNGWCLPVQVTPAPPSQPSGQPSGQPSSQPSSQPGGGAPAPLVDNLAHKQACGQRCAAMRDQKTDRICTPVVSGCGNVAMGCTGYVVTAGLPDKTTAARSACGKALLEKYLQCVTRCNDELIGRQLSWDYVGGCGARCNEIGMTDAAACDAGAAGPAPGPARPTEAAQPTAGQAEAPEPDTEPFARADLVGTWQWEAPPGFNRKTVVIHSDGTATVQGEASRGRWRWLGGDAFAIEWNDGQFKDNLTLASGKNGLQGTNQFGVTVIGRRIGLP